MKFVRRHAEPLAVDAAVLTVHLQLRRSDALLADFPGFLQGKLVSADVAPDGEGAGRILVGIVGAVERPDFLRSHPYLDVLVPLFLHTSVLDGRGCLTSFRRAKQRRCRSGAGHPASHFWGNKRSFVATKVQLACLENPATQGNVIPGSFLRQNYRGKGLPYKMRNTILQGTYHFDQGIGNVRLPGMSDKIYLGLCVPGHLASCCSKCEMKLTLVSNTGCRCAFHPRTIGNIIRLSDNKREKEAQASDFSDW